jgi:hypothetical protein
MVNVENTVSGYVTSRMSLIEIVDVSKENSASIFRVEGLAKPNKHQAAMLLLCWLIRGP